MKANEFGIRVWGSLYERWVGPLSEIESKRLVIDYDYNSPYKYVCYGDALKSTPYVDFTGVFLILQ